MTQIAAAVLVLCLLASNLRAGLFDPAIFAIGPSKGMWVSRSGDLAGAVDRSRRSASE